MRRRGGGGAAAAPLCFSPLSSSLPSSSATSAARDVSKSAEEVGSSSKLSWNSPSLCLSDEGAVCARERGVSSARGAALCGHTPARRSPWPAHEWRPAAPARSRRSAPAKSSAALTRDRGGCSTRLHFQRPPVKSAPPIRAQPLLKRLRWCERAVVGSAPAPAHSGEERALVSRQQIKHEDNEVDTINSGFRLSGRAALYIFAGPTHDRSVSSVTQPPLMSSTKGASAGCPTIRAAGRMVASAHSFLTRSTRLAPESKVHKQRTSLSATSCRS